MKTLGSFPGFARAGGKACFGIGIHEEGSVPRRGVFWSEETKESEVSAMSE